MTRKERVLQLLARGYEAEVAYASGLSPDQRSASGTWEVWSARDSISHCAAWRAHLASGLLAVSEGREAVSADDYHHKNRAIYEENCQKTWPEVEQLAATAHRSLYEQVSVRADADLDRLDVLPDQGEASLWQVAVGTGFSHPLMHVSDLLKQDGRIAEAAAVAGELASAVADLDDSADWQARVKYNSACRHALLGEAEAAIALLDEAFRMRPSLLEWSKQDPDLEPIRSEPACQALYKRHGHPPD